MSASSELFSPIYDPTRRFYLNNGHAQAAQDPDFHCAGDDERVFGKRLNPEAAQDGGCRRRNNRTDRYSGCVGRTFRAPSASRRGGAFLDDRGR